MLSGPVVSGPRKPFPDFFVVYYTRVGIGEIAKNTACVDAATERRDKSSRTAGEYYSF